MTVLYGMIHDAETCLHASTKLTEASFQDERNVKIFNFILGQKKRPIDIGILLADVSNEEYLTEQVLSIAESGASHMSSWAWVEESVEKLLVVQKKNELLHQITTAQNHLVTGSFTTVADLYVTIDSIMAATKAGLSTESIIATPEMLASELETRAFDATQTRDRGLKTGFTELDECIGGLRPGKLIVVAARPGMGKTALALNIAENVAFEQKKKVVFVSYEMERDELVDRIACVHLKKHTRFMRESYTWTQDTTTEIGKVADMIRSSCLYIGDKISRDIDKLLSTIALQISTEGVDLVIVDYLGLMSSSIYKGKTNKVQEVSDITAKLKLFALDHKLPVVVLSQLNREVEKRQKKRPNSSDLRDSGSIEQDADAIIYINRNQPEDIREESIGENEAMLIVGKIRDGQPRDIVLGFNSEQTRFLNPKKKEV